MFPATSFRWSRALSCFAALALGWCSILAGAAEMPGPGEKVEALPDMKVRGSVHCSFGFALSLFRDPATYKLRRLFIAKVRKRTSAAELGLRSGDEILSINGEKVRGMDGEARQGGKLFSLMCNRAPGETVEVEVLSQDRVQRVTLKAVKR